MDDTERIEKLQEIRQQAVVVLGNLNDMEKTISRLRNEANEILYPQEGTSNGE